MPSVESVKDITSADRGQLQLSAATVQLPRSRDALGGTTHIARPASGIIDVVDAHGRGRQTSRGRPEEMFVHVAVSDGSNEHPTLAGFEHFDDVRLDVGSQPHYSNRSADAKREDA
jgi:hypothetical protein